ncbi:MAG: hypothetical protein HWE26_17180 [Alteromonadaceae bacterium]|nr:hypothetical protein [Alteromonadaceae bacterium]
MTKLYAPLHTIKTASVIPFLEFEARPAKGGQERKKNRRILHPCLDLNSYKFKAVIDWVEVMITLGTKSQVQHIQKSLLLSDPRTCYVKEIDGNGRGTSESFRIRFQEPKSMAVIAERLEALAKKHPFSSAPQVMQIEVSVDAYSKAGLQSERQMLVGLLMRTFSVDDNLIRQSQKRPRFAWGTGSVETAFVAPKPSGKQAEGFHYLIESYNAPPVDATFYAGARASGALVRIMDKVKDTQKGGTFTDLPDAEKRARIEVRVPEQWLQSEGYTNLDAFKDFSFTQLQGDFFQFRLPLFNQVWFERNQHHSQYNNVQFFLKSGTAALQVMNILKEVDHRKMRKAIREQLGSRGQSMTDHSFKKVGAIDFLAYEELSRKVSIALQNLTSREKRAWNAMASKHAV